VTQFTFQPNGSGEQKCSAKFHELLEALPIYLGYQHGSILAPHQQEIESQWTADERDMPGPQVC
jgi:hypothetical protein